MTTGSVPDKRFSLARLADAQDASRGGRRRRWIQRAVGALVAVAMLAALTRWIGGFRSTPKEVLEIRTLVDKQISELQKVARNEAPLTYDGAELGRHWPRMREMPQEVRDQVRSEMERLFRARDRAEQQSYFAMPPNERQRELDRRIKAEESRRQAWHKERGNRNGGAGSNAGRGQGGAGGQGDAVRGGSDRGVAGGGATQASFAGPRGGGPSAGRPGGGRGGSEDARNARSKQRIDSTSPEERARSAEYRRAMDARRQQLGLGSGRGRGG